MVAMIEVMSNGDLFSVHSARILNFFIIVSSLRLSFLIAERWRFMRILFIIVVAERSAHWLALCSEGLEQLATVF